MALRAVQMRRERDARGHQGFLSLSGFRWAKIAALVCIVAIVAYNFDPAPLSSGGTAFGYASGTIAAALMIWLTLLGVRKRAMTRGRWSLKSWTSAHVWLGLSLIVITTLHSAFDFGWNLHTLAYGLVMIVILSGLFGVAMYATLPAKLSSNRDEATEAQMLETLRSIDRQLNDAAQPIDRDSAARVLASIDDDPFAGSVWNRLTGRYSRCKTRAAQTVFRQLNYGRTEDEPLERVDALLEKKLVLLARMRRHMRLKALLEIWLYVHVPVTFAAIAAVTAHVVAVFFFW